jgi:hypothetical protein
MLILNKKIILTYFFNKKNSLNRNFHRNLNRHEGPLALQGKNKSKYLTQILVLNY